MSLHQRLIAILILVLLQGCADQDTWYRGNTHTHTELCGHADSSPEFVTKKYHDLGYHFLVLSEHNKFINPETVSMPENKRNDFILIPGQEITGDQTIHTTAMNIDGLIAWKDEGVPIDVVIENHIKRTKDAGGAAILNHPHGGSNLKAPDILPATNVHMMELFNGSTRRNNIYKRKGMGYPLTAEPLWDELLTQGMFIYGVGSDDAHFIQTIGPDKSNAGLGWVMVRAKKLTPEAITIAMEYSKNCSNASTAFSPF
ncbi:CehA/McbA family metallohydrolase [Opitutales bacterium]|nr:CehA/McbA family metallohydrolase [Opitutales bacterium]